MALLKLPKHLHPDFANPAIKPIGHATVDTTNSLSQGLKGCYIFSESSRLNNAVEGQPAFTVTGSGPSIQANALHLSDSASNLSAIPVGVFGLSSGSSISSQNTDFTVIIKARLSEAAVGTNDKRLLNTNASSTGTDAPLYVDNTGSLGRVASFSDGGTKITVTSPEPSFDGKTANTFSLVWKDSDNSGTRTISIDGGEGSASATNAFNNTSLASSLYFFSETTVSHRTKGIIEHIYVFDRALSDSELREIHARPYQVLKPATPQFYFVPDEAPGNITGTLSETLENATSVASGTVGTAPTGTINVTLENTSSAASGIIANTGTISETLDDATSLASGTLTASGAISQTLGDATSTASGTLTVSGTISETLENAISAASGTLTITGDISELLESAVSTASGTAGDVVAGSISTTLDNTTSAANGVVPYTGAINETLDDTTSTASGSVVLNVSGTISETLAPATSAASGQITVNITGTLAEVLDGVSISASGSVQIDYETPKHNMTLTVENRIMTLTIENRIMRVN